ncbi:MAG: exodeoxyribonuclease V subunit gamma [Verrucomicrobia bacterium]|nr:exodeoxyribonuclease V subunit gamma [Verrucomicrobiota bacterium]MDA1065661.1 exodeoxyribonuclease V subunit gamma [Verrucomicrobiota bacterium]
MESKQADIQLFLSNRLENLADALIRQLASSNRSLLATDTILVQSRGMARWLNLRIADRTGIQMNIQYLYPRALIDQLLEAVVKNSDSDSLASFSSNALFWRIYQQLPNWADKKEAYVLRRYLESESQSTRYLRRYQLAVKIAQLMDQLQTFRPELLSSWSEERTATDWKSIVWQSLLLKRPKEAFPEILAAFNKIVPSLNAPPNNWPDRLFIFGISSLPPVYVEILRKASTWMPVSLFLTQPSPLYWGDQATRKRQLKAEEDDFLNKGHGLIGNLGKQGQDFLNTLIDADVFATDESEYFSIPESTNLLGALQKDLYELNAPPNSKLQIKSVAGIQVHVCHTSRREIEVLKDELHRCFESDPNLTPDQVIIMAPNIEEYSSAIRSVFGGSDKGSGFLPFSIADNTTRSSSPVAHALLELLDLLQSRFTANEVLNFWSIPVIANRFHLKQSDWESIRTWIEMTAIRWGINSNHRKQTTGSTFEEYSWEQGIERLVAGYCIHPTETSIWDDKNPFSDLEGNATTLLNQVLDAWSFLEQYQEVASSILKTSEWLEKLREIVDYLFSDQESYLDDAQGILALIEELKKESNNVKSDEPMTMKVISQILEARLTQDYQAGSFFSGTITFCSLKPMRNIPAQFIGLIGMNESAFPRRDIRSEFTQFPDGKRTGDRSIREDDRYLFLESILGARRHLYISYTGIESQTLKVQPSSIVVEELLDTLDDYYQFPNETSARSTLLIHEPLQGFSPYYFDKDQPISFSNENLKAARSLIESSGNISPQFMSPIEVALEIPDEVLLSTFQRFFANPSRFWLNQSLELNFPYQDRVLEDSEPIETNGLLEYKKGSLLIQHPEILSGQNGYLLNDLLPIGALQQGALEKVQPEVEKLLSILGHNPIESLPSSVVELEFEGHRLQGSIDAVTEEHHQRIRFGKIRGIDLIATWIEHLCLCAQSSNNGFKTYLIGKEEHIIFDYAHDSKKHLEELFSLFIQGHKSALPLFCETTHLFAKETLCPNSRIKQTPLEIAKKEFTKNPDGQFGPPGEAFNEFIALCFPESDAALSKSFEETALILFRPLYGHLQKGSL